MKKLLGVVFAVIGAAGMSQAAVIDGNVTSGGGSFEMIGTAGLTVGQNNQESSNLFAFNEVQNFTLTSDLIPDIGGSIAAGTKVSSHYVFFDPATLARRQKGFVLFDGPILGIITSTSSLARHGFSGPHGS